MISPVRAASAGAGAGRMRAWCVHAYGGTHELRLERAARVPAVRAPDELLVRVRAASLNPLDVAMTRGYGARALNALRALAGAPAHGVEFPLVCGRDFVGEVERAGAGARLRRGARVWGVVPPHRAGAHAQYVLVRERWASEAPAALSDAECGAAPYAALTACAALRAAGAARGARLLVLGLGGVGQAAVQLAAARGAHVTVGCAGEQAPLALALGAAAALDRHEPEYGARLEAAGPYAAVLDCAGLGGWEASARRWRFARYVTLTTPLLRAMDARGLPQGAAAAALQLLAQCWRVAAAPGTAAAGTATGGAAGPCPPHVRWAYFSPRLDDLEELRRLAESGRFRVCVEREFPWWEAPAAYARAAAGSARGKLVLDWASSEPAPAPAPAPASARSAL